MVGHMKVIESQLVHYYYAKETSKSERWYVGMEWVKSHVIHVQNGSKLGENG